MDLALRPLPRFHLRSTALLEYALCKRLEAALRGGGSVMNLVTTHYNCTSPMDYISHHALHTHIPVHHYTNHTAVTIHSLVLIASPHLHLFLTLTYKQHTYTHPLRSLVLPSRQFQALFLFWLPVYYLDLWLSLLIVCCLPYWPRLPTGYPLCLLPAQIHCSASVHVSVLSTLPSIPLFDICLSDLLFVSIKLQVDLLSPLTSHWLQAHCQSINGKKVTQIFSCKLKSNALLY